MTPAIKKGLIILGDEIMASSSENNIFKKLVEYDEK